VGALNISNAMRESEGTDLERFQDLDIAQLGDHVVMRGIDQADGSCESVLVWRDVFGFWS
jgi:hypothetical protein